MLRAGSPKLMMTQENFSTWWSAVLHRIFLNKIHHKTNKNQSRHKAHIPAAYSSYSHPNYITRTPNSSHWVYVGERIKCKISPYISCFPSVSLSYPVGPEGGTSESTLIFIIISPKLYVLMRIFLCRCVNSLMKSSPQFGAQCGVCPCC